MAGRIEDYAIVGDMQSVALIGTDGSVDWLCLPRFDSEACFAALLGTSDHGHWRIAPALTAGKATVTRRYAGDTLILETQWETAGGVARMTDFMPPRDDDDAPVLVRIAEGVSGNVDMDVTLRIRPGYGSATPWVRKTTGGIRATAGPDAIWLHTPVSLTGQAMAHSAAFNLAAGDKVPFVLTYMPSHKGTPPHLDPFHALEKTRKFWADWVSRCTYHGTYRDAVIRSLITLKALTYSAHRRHRRGRDHLTARGHRRRPELGLPVLLATRRHDHPGSPACAPGTPRRPGPGGAGWAAPLPGTQRTSRSCTAWPANAGWTEWEADWLPGYEGSAPVRIGNAAACEFQLDVYGEVIDTLAYSCRSRAA